MNDRKLFLILCVAFTVGLGVWWGMYVLTAGSDKHPLLLKLGETGATLAVVTVIGGLVQLSVKQYEEKRKEEAARFDFYRRMLDDLKSVYDRVESCRLLVQAHGSAKTYGEQLRELVGGVVTLHNIKRALDPGFPGLKRELEIPIIKMSGFLKELLKEFRRCYRSISTLQAADEAWNKHAREQLPKDRRPSFDYRPEKRAWKLIQRLPALAVLREDDDKAYKRYEENFVKWLNAASEALRRRLPVQEPEGQKPSPSAA